MSVSTNIMIATVKYLGLRTCHFCVNHDLLRPLRALYNQDILTSFDRSGYRQGASYLTVQYRHGASYLMVQYRQGASYLTVLYRQGASNLTVLYRQLITTKTFWPQKIL